MDGNSVLAVVSASQDAWTSRDMKTAANYVAEDIVFCSPRQTLTGAQDFISMLTAFSGKISPRWEMIASTTDSDGVLILYKLFTLRGTPAICADYFDVKDGKIQRETLVFDPEPFLA